MWRKLFKFTGRMVVRTEDSDGENRYRFAWYSPFGTLVCRKIWGKIVLLEDGTVKQPSYVKRWIRV